MNRDQFNAKLSHYRVRSGLVPSAAQAPQAIIGTCAPQGQAAIRPLKGKTGESAFELSSAREPA